MMGIDDIFISFITSYITGMLPSLKEIFSKKENKTLQERVDKCYEKALERWIADDTVRERIARRKFSSVNQLQELYRTSEWGKDTFALKNLTDLWGEELRKDEVCAHYIQEQEIKTVGDKIDRLAELLMKRDAAFGTQHIRRGLTKHKAVEGYIRRYCSSDQSESNFIYYFLEGKERRILADYVVGLEEVPANKFILYSSAQTGKTTELKQLCWELQHSGLYMPVSFEVRTNTKLKRDDLPPFQYVDDKEVVVVIDALDEVNGQKYDDLLEEIGGYAYEHPEMKIVLSCRSNYRRESQLSLFTELFLEELSLGDAREHIDNVLGKGNGLFHYIIDNKLNDFAKNPFFLNVLIDVSKENSKQLPKTKVEIYKLFIKKSYIKEQKDKNVPLAVKHSFDESVLLLERVALGLSLMDVQTLSQEEFLQCLHNNVNNVEECKRYDLIRCEDERYSFKHNAFREWLVANYLSHEGIEKAKRLASHPNGRIKPEWYNIIMLWLSMYGKERKSEINTILGWLKEASLDLVIYIDRDMLDDKTRNEVFKGLLLEYKSLGIRMSNITTQDYKNLLSFGQSEETVSFMADEIIGAKPGTAYYADLMCLCYFLNWEILSLQSKELTENLFKALLIKTKEALVNETSNDLSFLYFDNKFFTQKDYFERIFAIVGVSNHYEVIRSMIKLIDEANKVDEYVDYILEKEGYVHNQQEGNTTHVVSRTAIYTALSKLESLNGMRKILSHQFYNPYTRYHGEQDEYLNMMRKILGGVSRFIRQGHEELMEVLEGYYASVYKDYPYHFGHDELSQKFLTLLRECYQEAELRERGRKCFYEQLQGLFSAQKQEENSYETMRRTLFMAALWMTGEDVKEDFRHFRTDDANDRVKASRYLKIPYREVSECASALYNEIFPQPAVWTKGRIRRQKSFNDFADYKVFKQIVLEMVSGMDGQTTRKGYGKQLQAYEEGYNQYAFRFILYYVDNNDKYDIGGIIKGIKNRGFYEAFFMKEVSDLMTSTDHDQVLTNDAKERCLTCAKESILNLCQGGTSVYFLQSALTLMLEGYFEVPTDVLPKLLDYGELYISKKDEDGYSSREYTLFEYISGRVDLETLAPKVIEKLQKNIDEEKYRLSYAFSNYLIENHIEEGYSLALRFALTGFYMAGNILELLIKNRIMVHEIKAVAGSMNVSARLLCYSLLVRNAGEDVWVKEQLEPEFNTFNGYDLKRAVRLLLSIGSMVALHYLHSYPSLMNPGCDFYFNYDNPNATPSLCFFIKYNVENHIDDGPFMFNSIITSLERIATKSQDLLVEVKTYLRQLTQKGEQYKYLNRYINTFEDKYYAAYSGINDIKKVMELVDSKAIMKLDGGLSAEHLKWSEEDSIYISYSWEAHSSHIVDFLCFVLDNKEIPYKRDKKDCDYLDNIKEFMNAIRAGKTVIVVFSRPYLMSKNCMYELSGILKDPCFKERILPVVVDDTIRDNQYYVDLVSYWKKQKEEQENMLQQLMEIDPDMVYPQEVSCKEIMEVYGLLKEIKGYIDWMNADNLDALCATRFESIVKKICEKRNQNLQKVREHNYDGR